MFKIVQLIAALTTLSSYQGAENINRQEIFCLATAVYHEARGESLLGQIAVSSTILNRVRDISFKNTVCEVVYRPKQFTNINTARPDYASKEWETAVEVALFSYVGFVEDPTKGALWFYAQDKVLPDWRFDAGKEVAIVIAGHTFMRRADTHGKELAASEMGD